MNSKDIYSSAESNILHFGINADIISDIKAEGDKMQPNKEKSFDELFDYAHSLVKDMRSVDAQIITKFYNDPHKWRKHKATAEAVINAIGALNLETDSLTESILRVRKNIRDTPKCSCGNRIKLRSKQAEYSEYCSHICGKKYGVKSCSDYIVVDGVEYETIALAMRTLNIRRDQLRNRLFDKHDPACTYKEDHDEKCLNVIREQNEKLIDYSFVKAWKDRGETTRRLLDQLDISRHETIKLALLYHGIETCFDQIPKEIHDIIYSKKLVELLDSGYNSQSLADYLGVSPGLILNVAKNLFNYKFETSRSAIEIHLESWIKETYPEEEIVVNDRETCGVEIDIFFPKRKFGIELDGLLFHSVNKKFGGNENNHNKQKSKFYILRRNGIDCIFLTSEETTYKLDICKAYISRKLGKLKRLTIPECSFVLIDSEVAKNFHTKNNLEIGADGTRSYHIAAKIEDEIVCCFSYEVCGDVVVIDKITFENNYQPFRINKWIVDVILARHKTVDVVRYTSDLKYMRNTEFLQGMGLSYVETLDPKQHYTIQYNKTVSKQEMIDFINERFGYVDSKSFEDNVLDSGGGIYYDCGYRVFESKRAPK